MAFERGHALTIGVGSYQHLPQANIPISVTDARSVSDLLCDQNFCGYPPDQVKLLHDAQASRTGILEELEILARKITPEDTVLIYYCGHGDYGSDGNYYLTTHDTRVSRRKIVPGTGVGEAELLEKLRAIPAKRLLLLFNTCHSGEISPHLGLGDADKAFGDVSLPQGAADALLSSGEGRIIITACRPDQKSWIGSGSLSIFTQALVDGLSGRGYVPNNSGYVSAYGLYEHMYFAIKEAAGELGRPQEPELTVLKGVGPFPVSLYRGATELGMFDDRKPVPPDTAARAVSPERSERMFKKIVSASGERSVAIGGNVSHSTINTGDQNTNTQIATGSNIAQAAHGGTATVTGQSSGTVFDQRGLAVGTEHNVGSDLNQFAAGEPTDMSGDFRGTILNIKSTLAGVAQTIAASAADLPSKVELNRLIGQLSSALEDVPPEQADQAEAVAKSTELLVTTAIEAKPNQTMLQISGAGLKQAAQNLAAVAPAVPGIATQVVVTVAKLVQ